MKKLSDLPNLESYKNNSFNYLQYDLNQVPSNCKKYSVKWEDKTFTPTKNYSKEIYNEIMVFSENQVENTYLVYTNEYKIYFYDDGRRTENVLWSYSNNYTDSYRVKVPSAQEQYDNFLKNIPKAKYLVDYKKNSEDLKSSRKVIGDIIEVILLESKDYKNGIVKYIDSDRFTYNVEDKDYKITVKAGNPILAFELLKIEKEKYYEKNVNILNTYIDEFYDDHIDELLQNIYDHIGDKVVNIISETFGYIMGINFVTMNENSTNCLTEYYDKINDILHNFDFKNTEQMIEKYTSLLNDNLTAGKMVLKEYLTEIIQIYDIDYKEVCSKGKLTKELKKHVCSISKKDTYNFSHHEWTLTSIANNFACKLIKKPKKERLEDIKNSLFVKLADSVPIPSMVKKKTTTCVGILACKHLFDDIYERVTLLSRENPNLIKYISVLGNWLLERMGIYNLLYDTSETDLHMSILNYDNKFDDYQIIKDCKILFGGVCITEASSSKKEIHIKNLIYDCYVDAKYPQIEKYRGWEDDFDWATVKSDFKPFSLFKVKKGPVNLQQLIKTVTDKYGVQVTIIKKPGTFFVTAFNMREIIAATNFINSTYNIEYYHNKIFIRDRHSLEATVCKIR